jgi:hypothetical protein
LALSLNKSLSPQKRQKRQAVKTAVSLYYKPSHSHKQY